MPRQHIVHEKESIRLFKSDFLEFFTHISPITITIIWLPVIAFFFYRAFTTTQPLWIIPIAVVLGLFIWTFAEYTLHRFVFHFHPKGEFGKRIVFLFHGIHHTQPKDKTRLVMPPVVSIPLAALFYGLFYLVVVMLFKADGWLAPLFALFMAGYLAYDLIHYATHHWPMKSGIGKFLTQYHLKHHYKTPDARYGVSSPLWDKVFRTMPADI